MTDHATLLRQISREQQIGTQINAIAEGEPLTGDVAGAGSFPPRETASLINSEIHREPSNRDVSTDGKAWQDGTSQGNRPVSSSARNDAVHVAELASHEGDTQGEGASALSPINSELSSPGRSTDPQINRGRCAEAGLCADQAQDGSISGDETTERFPGTTAEGLDVCQLDRSLLVTAGRATGTPLCPSASSFHLKSISLCRPSSSAAIPLAL